MTVMSSKDCNYNKHANENMNEALGMHLCLRVCHLHRHLAPRHLVAAALAVTLPAALIVTLSAALVVTLPAALALQPSRLRPLIVLFRILQNLRA